MCIQKKRTLNNDIFTYLAVEPLSKIPLVFINML